MNLHHLRVFLAVAEDEHITKASKKLILSQPAVSKTIQSLEREVGVTLVERQGRRITLTHAGRVLYVQAQQLFSLEQAMVETLEALRDGEMGKITLAANTTSGVYLLPPIVARFRDRYPQVELHMTILNSQDIIDAVLSWQVDVGLVEGDPALLSSLLKVDFFAHDELILVVAPRHPLAKLQRLQPTALQREQLLLREEGSGIREVIEEAFCTQGIVLQPLFTLPDNEAIKRMVMSGVGAAILSTYAVQRELAAGELVNIPIDGVVLRPQLSVIRRQDKQLSQAASVFCDGLLALPR